MNCVASCAFGLEAIVARELVALGFSTKTTGPGQVEFTGDWSDVARANLWLRCADRISLILADFDCKDFDTLYDTTRAFDWSSTLTPEAKIHITGGSVKSQLSSVPAIQRTVKKAIVDHLLKDAGLSELPETGALFRIHIGLRNDRARVSLDTTGPSLHKRGYREISTKAPLKETLAAALVQLTFWRPDRPLIDPFCGGGTILIEAAMLARKMAPGLNRSFACEAWPNVSATDWNQAREAARTEQLPNLAQKLIGNDIHGGALSLARRNAETAGVADDIHFQQREFANLRSGKEFGCIITNPPYGDRLEPTELRQLYESMPVVLKNLPTWSHFILTAFEGFERLIGREADRRRKLYNGRIECTYYQFHGPRPGDRKAMAGAPVEEQNQDQVQDLPTETQATTETDAAAPVVPELRPVFGGLTAKAHEQAQLFASRLTKRARHLRRWPTRRGITCYRIYERDIPEIPLVVDRYEDWIHILEFERPHDRDLAQHAEWLDLMAKTAGEVLECKPEHVVLKTRQRQQGLEQHEKLNNIGDEITVHEGGLKFLVNLTDYTDTGLFLDHRAARSMVRKWCGGQRVLNLFAYTGAFSVYAADGGATSVTTVDWSQTYLEWARRNFDLNEFLDGDFAFIREDTRKYVEELGPESQFDVIVCDPPTFSNSKRTDDVWDVQKDHVRLISKLLQHLSPDGTLFFSSNFRRLKFDAEAIPGVSREVTRQTLPEEFRNQRIHRSWTIRHGQSGNDGR